MTDFDVSAYLENRRGAINAALDAALVQTDDDPGRLREAMRYAVLDGGKRMRPLLVVAACEAVGGTLDAALPAACAIEMIHAYSLVHDDLPAMDDDAERRGKPTVHIAFGDANAILVGDALLTHAFHTLAAGASAAPGGRLLGAVVKMAHHAGVDGMVGGQALDLEAGQEIGDLAVLERVHALKTGGLYAASGAMGALSGGADDDVSARLEAFGLAFGIAFQHADDVLDDDQKGLRAQALARVDELTASCLDNVASLGEAAEPLRGIARWVAHRAHAAHRGEIKD